MKCPRAVMALIQFSIYHTSEQNFSRALIGQLDGDQPSTIHLRAAEEKQNGFCGILSQIKLLFGPLVIQLVWYILKQLFTSVSVNRRWIFTSTSEPIIVKYRVALNFCINLVFAYRKFFVVCGNLFLRLQKTGFFPSWY